MPSGVEKVKIASWESLVEGRRLEGQFEQWTGSQFRVTQHLHFFSQENRAQKGAERGRGDQMRADMRADCCLANTGMVSPLQNEEMKIIQITQEWSRKRRQWPRAMANIQCKNSEEEEKRMSGIFKNVHKGHNTF